MYYPVVRQCIQALKNLETWLDRRGRAAAGHCRARPPHRRQGWPCESQGAEADLAGRRRETRCRRGALMARYVGACSSHRGLLPRDFDVRRFNDLRPSHDLILQHLGDLSGIHHLRFKSRGP